GRVRPARARDHHFPLRPAGVHRPPGAQLGRLPEVHRGRLPLRRPARPAHRPSPGPPARRPRGPVDPGQPGGGLRLQPATAPPPPPPRPPPAPLPPTPPPDSPSPPAYFPRQPACVGCTIPPPG